MPTEPRTLQDLVDSVSSVTEHLHDNQTGPRVYPVVRPEYSNWRDEQLSWFNTVCLRDQSYHMTDIFVSGPDAFRLMNTLAINSFRGFEPEQAKQMVVCNPDGHVIGDGIMFYLEKDRFQMVGRPAANNWIEFQASAGGYHVDIVRDRWSVDDPAKGRRTYRFQLRGPKSGTVLQKLSGGKFEPLALFHMGWTTIAGHEVRYLSWPGVEGTEVFGPFEEGNDVKAAILEAGAEFEIRLIGSRAYPSHGVEHGWIASPLPAVYTSPEMRPYREWLPATSHEGVGSLCGSFYSEDIADYYLTPWELGYGHILKFDHDFVGREALEAKKDEPHRKKMTLEWNTQDVLSVFASLFEQGPPKKYIELPLAQYGTWMYDQVLDDEGNQVGVSCYCGYSANERAMLSLAMLDQGALDLGTEVRVVWGERDGGSRKPAVERHVQTEIRATVRQLPYSEAIRRSRQGATKR